MSLCKNLGHTPKIRECPGLRPTVSWLQVQSLTLHDAALPTFDPDLLEKSQNLTLIKRLLISDEAQNMAAIKAFCRAHHIELWLEEGWADPLLRVSLDDEAPNAS